METNEKPDDPTSEVDPRFPLGVPKARKRAAEKSAETPEWTQVPGRPAGVQIHRDGKTLRNLGQG